MSRCDAPPVSRWSTYTQKRDVCFAVAPASAPEVMPRTTARAEMMNNPFFIEPPLGSLLPQDQPSIAHGVAAIANGARAACSLLMQKG
jgi:hypothetical protein